MRTVFSTRKGLFLLLALLFIGIGICFPALYHGTITKAQATGSISSILPTSGTAGLTSVTIQGTGFGATLKGKITLGGHVVSNFYTDSSGNFTQTFTVPSWASAGATTITATNTSTSASTSFTVTANATKPNRVNPMCVASHLDHSSMTNSDIDTQLTLMQQAGVKYTRFDFLYNVVNPSSGVWDFSLYDNIATRSAAKGINIIAILEHYGLPNYLLNGRQWSDAMQPSEYATFTQAVASHFQGQIPLYEMGNEPNFHLTAASYSAIMKAGYPAIKAGDPNAKVISAGLGIGGTAGDPVLFLQQLYGNGVKGYFDYLGAHPYSQPNGPDFISQTSSTPSFNILARMKRVMEENGDRTKQIMVTEVGYPVSGSGAVGQTNQTNYIARVYTKIMHEDYQYVPIACIYDFVNDGTDATNAEDNFGVLNTDYSQKPSYTSLQNASSDFSPTFRRRVDGKKELQ